MRNIFLFTILLVFTTTLFSQDLSGTWEGRSTNAASYMKLVIIRHDNKYIGYSYDEGAGFCKANFEGAYDESSKTLTGKGTGFIQRSPDHSLMRFRLKYDKRGGTQYLEGTTGPASFIDELFSLGFAERVTLQRTSPIADTTNFMYEKLRPLAETTNDTIAIEKKSEPVISPAIVIEKPIPAIISAKENRKADTLSTIITNEKIITISIYDNGQVDGDTITIFHNNKILLADHLVSAKPYKISITVNKDEPHHEIMLVANNLGSIPPNTAVLNITAGDKQYRLTASADLRKNALVIFNYKE